MTVTVTDKYDASSGLARGLLGLPPPVPNNVFKYILEIFPIKIEFKTFKSVLFNTPL